MYYVVFKKAAEVRACSGMRESYEHEIPALAFLHLQSRTNQYGATAKGFRSLFERYATSGRRQLTAEMFHEVDSKNEIWEFVRGDLRIFCFKDGPHIVLTHGAIKKTRKVDQKEITTAVSAKKKYLEG